MILLGNGVVANISLKYSKGLNGGFLLICTGWGMAVFVGAFIAAPYSGAHLNPALTLALYLSNSFQGNVIGYMIAQMLGAIIGAFMVYLNYKPHYDAEEDKDVILGTFCTSPALKNYFYNFLSELFGTFLLVLGILLIAGAQISGPLPVGLLVMAIGMSLGGTTGFAINPARDLGARIAHALLPIANKRDSNWNYAWVPVVGPIVGAILASLFYLLINQ